MPATGRRLHHHDDNYRHRPPNREIARRALALRLASRGVDVTPLRRAISGVRVAGTATLSVPHRIADARAAGFARGAANAYRLIGMMTNNALLPP